MNNYRNLVPVGYALRRISARKVLLLSLVAFALLCLYRAYNLWTTGFFVSDEYGYIQNAIQGSIYNNAAFGYRVFIAVLDVSLFRVLGIHNIDSFIVLFPFYLFLWGAVTLCSTYLMLQTIETGERIVKFTLFSSFFLVSFVLLSLGFLTEPVGLSLAMLGILCLLRFAKQRMGGFGYFAYPLFGALALGAARYTREPYALFLVGGVLVVLIMAFNQVKSSNKSSRPKVVAMAAVAIMLYSGPSLFLLNNPVPLFAQAGPSIESFGNTFTHPVISSTTVGTGLILNNQIVNTLWIFFAGIALGWGPILFVVGLVGFVLLTRRVISQRDLLGSVLLVLVLTALGSYFFVSYIFSPDPNYLTLGHYSTIIRFSDTTLPAYFLTAPFAFAALARRKHWLTSMGVLLVIFLIVAVPTYESYAASTLNLDNNPFSLGYRSPGVQIRNYVSAGNSSGPYHIMMVYPNNVWFWTPGNTLLNSVDAQLPLNQSQFVQMHWSVFYVYADSMITLRARFPYLFNATQSTLQATNTSVALPFVITSRQVVFDNHQGAFIQMKASWPA